MTATRNVASIQILRAAAALGVATVHFQALFYMLQGNSNAPRSLHPLAAGVDLFFVISGFIMVYSSERLFGREGAGVEFFTRRLARIVPLYWLTMAFAIYLQDTPFSVTTVIESYLFIPFSWPNGKMHPLYGVGWTLNFEMFFYVIFAAAICFRREVAVALVSATLIVLVIIGQRFSGLLPDVLRLWSDPIVLEFILGMVLALLFRNGVRLPLAAAAGLVLLGAIAIWGSFAGTPPSSGWRWLQWGLPMALAAGGAALVDKNGWERGRIARAMTTLGEASYSLYLVHSLVLAAIVLLRAAGHLQTIPLFQIVVGGEIVTIALSIAVHKLIEAPLSAAFKRALVPRRELVAESI